MFTPGPNEVLLIVVIALLLFGAHKIPEAARSLGKSIAEFKKAQIESEIDIEELENKNLNKIIIMLFFLILIFISPVIASGNLIHVVPMGGKVILHPDNSSAQLIFETNYTFYNLTVSDKDWVKLNSTILKINSVYPANLTVVVFDDAKKIYTFRMSSTYHDNFVIFNISNNIPGMLYFVYKNNRFHDKVRVDEKGWLNYTYRGGFSDVLITFQPAKEAVPTPTTTPTPPPLIPPITPIQEKSPLEVLCDQLFGFWWLIVLILILVAAVLLLRS